MPFVVSQKEHPYILEMLHQGFSRFADIHICCFSNYRELPVHFVGSVAYYFTEVLRQVAQEKGFEIGNVIKSPAASLLKYHLQRQESLHS
jgi:hypothetical protein